ncbi:VirB8/TrbF family protein [Geomonas azotofigens]|uniref:VirB8/TrbF family protein n=1 Tax=Geomonas azotofigens TaxID=2843196 RepID=UPI001C0F7F50|nr:VirB8/TrbF family protein [Geomonas azotofigens]MBU5612654.1 conjugal transfer protein TrbF [Geomonas azotofigens]
MNLAAAVTAARKLIFGLPAEEGDGSGPVTGGRRQGENENPYLAARRTWNSLMVASIANRQMWQLFGILSLMITLASVGGMIYIGSQSRFVPYVVEVDKHGGTIAIAPAQRAVKADPRVVHFNVASFISDLRLVTPDIALQRKAIYRVYSMLSIKDPATAKANEWLNGTEESSPFKRAEKETVSVEISSVLPQTPDTWQVDWIEAVYDRQGVMKAQPYRMRALVTVYTLPATTQTTEEQIRNNPLGTYVRDFSWSRQL